MIGDMKPRRQNTQAQKKGCGAYRGRKTEAIKQSNNKRRKQDKALTKEPTF
jgi:hypothetical protein